MTSSLHADTTIMGFLNIFNKRRQDDSETENDVERDIRLSEERRKRLAEETLARLPEMPAKENGQNALTVSKHEVSFPGIRFHPDIKDLIWFADGPLKNIDAGKSVRSFSGGGITVTCTVPGMEEPSQIFTRMPVEIPESPGEVGRPPYYPTYAELTPLQKGAYLRLLENPYNPDIDIGFVFILYYGLERHLLCGDTQRALEVILRLRDVHANKSFQQYSAGAAILSSIYTGKGEIAVSFLRSLDKEHEIRNFPADLYLLCASSFGIPMFAPDIVRMSSWFGFDNRLYIKKYPELFSSTLTEKIEEMKQRKYLLVSDFLTESEINGMRRHEVTVFANTSLRDIKVRVPSITESGRISGPVVELLQRTHDAVKAVVAEKRKSGEIPKEPKKEVRHREKKTMPQLVKELQEGAKEIPSPAGYEKSIRALRGMRRLDPGNAEEYLRQIYALAAQYSMCVPYSEYCKCPGFNIIEIIPPGEIERLQYTYDELGYEELYMLSVTDIKELIKLWGEPASHSTLNKMHSGLWHEYEVEYKRRSPF